MSATRPKLLAINQSVSTLFRSLLDELAAEGIDIKLLAGYLETEPGYGPRFEYLGGCPLRKSPAWRRLWTWGRFTWQAFRAMARHRDHFVLLVTNPPLVPWMAPFAQRLFGTRYAELIYDVYPDVMVRMGMIPSGGLIHRLLRRRSAAVHRRAACVITIGRKMAQTIQAQMPAGEALEVHVIPNWADLDFIRPHPRAENPFSVAHGLVDKFVVMYSGAFGATHDIESIVDAAEQVTDLPDVRFVLIGGGTRQREVAELVKRKSLPNLLLLPLQPSDMIRHTLPAADCQIVSLDEPFEGISVPSKTYSSLAAGAAILAISPPDTELTDLVSQHACGVWIRPHRPDELSAAVRRLHAAPTQLRQMQANSRRTAEQHYHVRACARQYRELLEPFLAAQPTQRG